jgi:hypothetical protein
MPYNFVKPKSTLSVSGMITPNKRTIKNQKINNNQLSLALFVLGITAYNI